MFHVRKAVLNVFRQSKKFLRLFFIFPNENEKKNLNNLDAFAIGNNNNELRIAKLIIAPYFTSFKMPTI